MPDADASPLRPEPNTNDQANEYPTTERPMTEKTKSTAEKEPKAQDAVEEKAGDSSEASTEDEEHIEFDEWVKSFAADPDAAWKQMQLKFEALMATDSDGYITQDIQEDDEDADHEENCECCECESPGLPKDYPKDLLEQAKKLCQGES
ncbi:hypothetical protein LCI18_003962 [Fusarium solani-melongenae]|uniref:Uncharacterized protein n=1 Tax=Fusarium solani subsp. cucurbitae TaxID=2747967 RepID=A0ACD3YVM6_FUSSC|nr:hypothetical protein LCI18_003962 [Fusarium solani-melongenae]